MSGKIIEGPKLKSTVPAKSFGQLCFDCAEKYGDILCQVDGTTDETETYTSVKRRSTRVAIELQEIGITSEDVIAFCTGNTIDTVIPILATLYLGAKVANLEPSLSIAQTKHLISLARPKIIFVEEASISLIEESLKEINFQTRIIVFGQSTKYISLSELTRPKNNENTFKPVEVDIHDIAWMFFSSGTTGLPKAICHSHYSCLHSAYALYDYGLEGAILHFTTFYWVTAMFMFMGSFLSGGYRVFCRTIEAENTFKVIEKYKIKTTFFAPILTNKLTSFEHAENYDTSSLRHIYCGGTPLSPSQFQKMADLFKHSSIIRVYGITEACTVSMFHFERDKRFLTTKTTSCGKLIYAMKLKIVDHETNKILGPNQKGEIRLKTPCLCKGYYKADSSDIFDNDGFLKTGDIGYYDEDECVYVIERIKEMFKYQSWHIVPASIEAVLVEHPAIKEAAVFGVPYGDDGEAPAACIILNNNSNVSKEEIAEFVAKRVSDREKLRGGITFATTLPKTPTGKLIRKEIRNWVIKSS